MPGRRWGDGLHQAIEAKEKLKIEKENKTYANITFQNFFRLYEKISGMTGTADTEAEEFKAIYNLGAKELGVTNPNPFTGIFIPDNGTVIERLPVPLDVIRTIQDDCFEIDDDNRWLIAMIADTGMRLSEAVGLLVDDIKLDETNF